MYSLGETTYTPKEMARFKKNRLDWFNHYKSKGCNDKKAMECAGRKSFYNPFHLN